MAILTVCAGVAAPAFAEQEVLEIPTHTWPQGTLLLGGGVLVGESLYRGLDKQDRRPISIIPLVSYNGKYLFTRASAGGIHLINKDHFEINLLARFRFEHLDPESNEFYEGFEERRQTVDGGVELRARGDWGEFDARLLTDTFDRHQGQSTEVSYRYNFDHGRMTLSPFVSWAWHDDNLTNYYYGVSAEEARPDLPEYTPGASQRISFGLNTTYSMSDRVALYGNVGVSVADSAVTNSPIVENGNTLAVFLGGNYMFGNVYQRGPYISPERASEWSWKANYGYAADGNIVSEIDQGDFSRSQYADTSLAGITIGKLLRNGTRADFIGRFAVYRHFEESEGNGTFNNYAAYIMIMGRGHSRWSGDEWFRWGFGYGLSYAVNVPIVEQRKQAERNGSTSHLLTYLEMQLDFPLRRLFKAKSLQNCYAGLTTVHRSGLFGSSDILGRVAGGSDVLTAHIECMRS